MTLLAPTLQAWFTDRLMTQKNASPCTIAAYRDTLRLLMSEALSEVGDTYRAPDGIRYSLIEAPGIEDDDDRLTAVSSPYLSSRKSYGSRTFRSDRSARVARSFAGATAPKAKGSSGTGTRSWSAKAIMGTLGLCPRGFRCVV